MYVLELRQFRRMKYASAAQVYKYLGGIKTAGGYLCHCPVAHHGKGKGDRRPSLSVSDGDRGLKVHCFAGCSTEDINFYLHKLDLSHPNPVISARKETAKPKTTTADALRIWSAAIPLKETRGEAYLKTRALPPDMPTLRFYPSFRFSKTTSFDCVVAAMQNPDRAIVAVQLTFLDRVRSDKAPVDHPRRIIGPAHGAALRLAPVAETLGLAEGYETGHAAMLLHHVPVWCSLGSSRLPLLRFPQMVRRLIVFADPDKAGKLAAEATVQANPSLDVEIRIPDGLDDYAAIWKSLQLSK